MLTPVKVMAVDIRPTTCPRTSRSSSTLSRLQLTRQMQFAVNVNKLQSPRLR